MRCSPQPVNPSSANIFKKLRNGTSSTFSLHLKIVRYPTQFSDPLDYEHTKELPPPSRTN